MTTPMTPYPHLLEPVTLAGVPLRNRVVMGSMHTGMEDRARHLPELAAYFAERARGGAGRHAGRPLSDLPSFTSHPPIPKTHFTAERVSC